MGLHGPLKGQLYLFYLGFYGERKTTKPTRIALLKTNRIRKCNMEPVWWETREEGVGEIQIQNPLNLD
jgi:hypothetical protein